MNRKARDPYDAVLGKVIDVFATENPELTINTERPMTDYESAIQGALKQDFMGCDCHGCWFHYKQVYQFIYFQFRLKIRQILTY